MTCYHDESIESFVPNNKNVRDALRSLCVRPLARFIPRLLFFYIAAGDVAPLVRIARARANR